MADQLPQPGSATTTPPPAPVVVDVDKIRAEVRAGFDAELKEVRNEAAAYRTKARELEAKAEAVQASALAEQGKYKDLYEKTSADLAAAKKAGEELDALRAKEAKRLERVRETVKARLEKLPEEARGLVPSSLDPEEQLEHVSKLEALVAKGAVGTQTGTTGTPAPRPSPSGAPPLVTPSGTGVPTDPAEFKSWLGSLSQEERARVDVWLSKQRVGNALFKR